MRSWVLAGLAQYDHVHFTAPGYRMLGEAAVKELLAQYAVFQKARESFTTEQISNGQTNPDR